MKFNASKTVLDSLQVCTIHHQSSTLTLDGTSVTEFDDLVLLGVTFDARFQQHLRSVSRPAAQRLSIMRHSWKAFHDRYLLMK